MLPPVPVWHRAPFLRFLIALAAGLVAQDGFSLSLAPVIGTAALGLGGLVVYYALPAHRRFRWIALPGAGLHLLFLALGAGLLQGRRQDLDSRMAEPPLSPMTLVELLEDPVEKGASSKVLAARIGYLTDSTLLPGRGSVLVYLAKEERVAQLKAGSRLLLRRPPQLLRRTNNPGAFEYRDYCYRQGITHQAFLAAGAWEPVETQSLSPLGNLVYRLQHWTLDVLRRYLPDDRERGLAEALLMGYKNDLDRDLVQAYSDTGVVHVIAISGLHLGLIYALLLLLTRPLRRWSWLRFGLLLSGLWIFALLAGASPSVLRSAVMFSFLAGSALANRRTQIINTLALSAFVLLCFDPFWLWDAGFQLSYSAVLSILLFYRPVYGWLYFPNRAMDFIWQLSAVTIAAQLLTLPVSIYHFHQLPLLFLFTNIVAVPLSSLILLGELLLCLLSPIGVIARPLGAGLTALIRWMNGWIEHFAGLPFTTWDSLSISSGQAVLLTLLVLSTAYCWMERLRWLWPTALVSLMLFLALRSHSFVEAQAQQRLVIFDLGRSRALGLISGRHHWLYADSNARAHPFFRSAIRAADIRFRSRAEAHPFPVGPLRFGSRIIYFFDRSANVLALPPRLDLLLVSGRTPCTLTPAPQITQVVADATVTPWYLAQWKQHCDSLRIPFHSIRDSGAFVLDLR